VTASPGELRLYRRLLREARPFRLQIAGLSALSLMSSVFALLTPVPLKIAVDSIVSSSPLPGFMGNLIPVRSQSGVLLVAAAMFVTIALLKQTQQLGVLVLSSVTGQRLLLGFRSRLFRHAERLSFAYHDSIGTSDAAYRIQYDAQSLQTVVVTGAIPFVTALATVIGMIYVTARIDGQLALVALAVVPVLLVLLRGYRSRLRGQWRAAKRLDSEALAVVHEALDALRVVKAFGQEDRERDRFVGRSQRSVQARIDLAHAEGTFGMLIGLVIGLGMGTVLFLGSQKVLAGTLSLGNLVLIMGYLQQLYDPLRTASKKAGDLQGSLASVERVYALLDHDPDLPERVDGQPLARARGAVAFEHVSFGYTSRQQTLTDVSFAVAPGTCVGIGGPTGAGKTTLVSLLTRFYDPDEGRVVVDGVDVREYQLDDLRNQFAIVLQEPVLFSVSIAENIAYGRPEADRRAIVAAAEAANAHRFITDLPDGYDTQVGERGMRLSGGERQRVALARAFLKDAPILILDEPTSSVDMRTEAVIMEAMQRLMERRTTFMIAHRVSTLDRCDMRLEVEDGRLGEAPAAAAGVTARAPGWSS
jgi:ATP-binding cassette subfamily B protein